MNTRTRPTILGKLGNQDSFLLIVYTFFMGIVFFEPAFAEWLVLFTVPFVLYKYKTRWKLVLGFLLTIGLVRLTIVINQLIQGNSVVWRFNLIGLYLAVMFLWTFLILENQTDFNRLFRNLMVAWITIALINTGIGLLAIAVQNPYLFGLPRAAFGGVRITGMFKDPNVYGSFLILPLGYLLVYSTSEENKRNALIAFVVLLILGSGLVLSFSRASWLGGAVTIVLLLIGNFFSRNKRVLIRSLVLVILGGLFLTAILLFDFNLPIFDSVTGERLTTLQFFLTRTRLQWYDRDLRFVAWDVALEVFSSAPMFGISPGRFESYHTISVHNSYLRFLVELGILGVFAHIGLAGYLGYRKIKYSKPPSFLVCSVIGMLVAGLFIDAFHWRHLIFAFALLVAVEPKKRKNIA